MSNSIKNQTHYSEVVLSHYDFTMEVNFENKDSVLEGAKQYELVAHLEKMLDDVFKITSSPEKIALKDLKKKNLDEVTTYLLSNPDEFLKRTPMYDTNKVIIRLTPNLKNIQESISENFYQIPNKLSFARVVIWIAKKVVPDVTNLAEDKQREIFAKKIGGILIKFWKDKIEHTTFDLMKIYEQENGPDSVIIEFPSEIRTKYNQEKRNKL